MATFEFVYGGEEYVVDAVTEEDALNKLSKLLGSQAAETMTPGVDFGQAPAPRPEVFGDVTAEAMEQPLEALQYYRQRAADPERSLLQRAGDVGMTGLSALGAGYAGAAGLAAELIAGDRTQERKLARDLMMMGEVAVPELAGVTSSAARLGRQVRVGQTVPGAREIGEMTPRMERARIAEEMGVLPSASMQGQAASMLEGGLEASPISSGMIQRGTQRVVGELEEAGRGIAQKAGVPTTKEAAGAALRTGAETFVNDFTRKSEALYGQLDNFVDPNDMITAPNTAAALQDIMNIAQQSPQIADFLGVNRFATLLEGIGPGQQIPYGAIKRLRTKLGQAIGNIKGPLADMDQGEIKELYGTLSADMEAAARAKGPEAYKAWKRANDFYSAGRKRIDDTLSKITGADGETAAYRKLENMLLEGNVKQSTSQIMQIKKSLPKDDFDSFRSTLISNLGRSKPGQAPIEGEIFSPSTFVTNYNRMEPTSRKVVFGELDKELNDFAKIADMAKDASLDINRSRTGNVLSVGALGALIASGQFKTAVGIAALNLASGAAMTNKSFLRALNAAAKKDMGPLQRIAGGDGYLAAEAATILRTLSAQQANTAQ